MSKAPDTLVLFDIDGTLVDCGRSSGKCFAAAFQQAFGVPCPIFSPEDVAGLTDAAILKEVVRRLDRRWGDFDRRRDLAFEIYARNLAVELKHQPARALPGAHRAIQAVRGMAGFAVGLLTGSTEATAKIKIESAGIDFGQFACGAYSEDGESRESLPPTARARFSSLFAREPKVTILIGDTPRDVQAARATGCEFVGVTTGPYHRAALEEAGARVILNDLTETETLCRAIEAASRRPSGI